MRTLISLMLGGLYGLVLGSVWLLAIWVWNSWGVNLAQAIFSSSRNAPSPLIMSLVPIVAGVLVYGYGIAILRDKASEYLSSWANPKHMAISAVGTSFIFTVFLTALCVAAAYSASGFDRFIFSCLSVAYFVLPTWVAAFIARVDVSA